MINDVIDERAVRDLGATDGVTHFATGIAIFRSGKLLVARRVADDFLGGMYELPGGGVDDGETITEGAIRETFEETGLRVSHVISIFEGFDYQTKTKPKVRQINFKVEVEPGEVALEPTEHDEYCWISAADIDTLPTTDKMKRCLHLALV